MKSKPTSAADNPTHYNKKTWFISDLHLDVSRPEIFTLLHDFLNDIEDQAEALYILGDLFEFWIGDDLLVAPAGKEYQRVAKHLRKLSDKGIKLYFMQGNRDFLVRNQFIKTIRATLLPDTHIIQLYGTPTILLHGDTLCTDDKSYQRMRTLFRIRWLQNLYLSLSLEHRSKQAASVRKATHKQVKNKHYEILDVNQSAVENMMRKNNVIQMIHGHTHRPATHEFILDGKHVLRYVLGDWHDKASFLQASRKGIKLVY